MDIIYEPDIGYRRALQIDRMWGESDFTETRDMIQRRKREELLDKFEKDLFRINGEMMRARGTLNFALLRAVKK